MKNSNYLKGFEDFSSYPSINEMASELTKLGIPKNLMTFIHKLGGKINAMSQGDSQIDSRTGTKTQTFNTRKEPYKAKGGPWPEREDVPLSHDVQVAGTKTGKRNIYHYLTNVLDSRKDMGLRLILVNPTLDHVHYLTRKTGKMSAKQLADAGIEDTEEARTKGISQKRGLYIRAVTIDGDSGKPISTWVGTIGQMAEDMDKDSVLYIMEQEDKVRNLRTTRKDRTQVTEKGFMDEFIKNFSKVANNLTNSQASKNKEEFSKMIADLGPGEWKEIQDGGDSEKARKLSELADSIEDKTLDADSLLPKLNNFLELAFKEGEYEKGKQYGDTASLTQMVDIHTMPTVMSMFLQYIILGKVYKKFHTDDPVKELGLEDLF